MGPQQILPLRVRVDLGVIAIKRYFISHNAPGLEYHYQMQFIILSTTLTGKESYSAFEIPLVPLFRVKTYSGD